jgi:hypothetical protein
MAQEIEARIREAVGVPTPGPRGRGPDVEPA